MKYKLYLDMLLISGFPQENNMSLILYNIGSRISAKHTAYHGLVDHPV